MKLKSKLPTLSLLLVAVIWGSGFVASSQALDHNSTNSIIFLRFAVAALALFILKYKAIMAVKKDLIKDGLILGFIIYGAFYFQTRGLEYTTAANNAFITSTNILLVPIIALILDNRKVHKKEIFGLLLASLGLLLIASEDKFGQFNKGDVLTFVSAIFFALQIYFTGRFVADYEESDIVPLMFFQMFGAALVATLPALLQKEQINFSASALSPILYLGLVSTLLAYFLQTNAQKKVDPVKTALILSTESIFGAIFSVVLLSEYLSFNTIIGSVLIFLSIIIVELRGKGDIK